MSEHRIAVRWKRESADFSYETYNRSHVLRFEGGQEILASSAPEFFGKAEQANPEEMLAAALSSCHMLTFLAIAARSRLIVESYQDQAIAVLEKNEAGKQAVTRVLLRPVIVFSGSEIPDAEKIKQMHEKAHRNCFIANSVACQVIVESV
jgi:organic hydroperoxide reductase OsmC/OhrA